MASKKNDEWGLIIQKQLELDKIRNEAERIRMQQKKETYRNELDSFSRVKQQQKYEERLQREKEAFELSQQVRILSEKESLNTNRRLEINQKVIEDNIRLEKQLNFRRQAEKITATQEDIKINLAEHQKILENLSQKQSLREKYEKTIDYDIELSKYKQELKRQENYLEKVHDRELIQLEQQRLLERDSQYKQYFSGIQSAQSRKMEAFSKNTSPQLVEKEINYYQWVQKAEEAKRRAESQQDQEKERKRLEDIRVVNETLRKQAEEKHFFEVLNKEKNRAIDEDLLNRIDVSMKIDQERNMEKKIRVLNYREELLSQAALDKEKRGLEFKLSEKEKQMNRFLLENDKKSLQRGANEVLKPVSRSPNLSPSCQNTTLQMDYVYRKSEMNGNRMQRTRNSIF